MEIILSELPTITKGQLKKVAVVGTHLHQWQGHGVEGLHQTFHSHGFIQLDPINPAGRNHDFFFFSRIPEYKQGDFEREIYTKGEMFENYFHLLNTISREYFPLFYSRRKERYLGKFYLQPLQQYREKSPKLMDKVHSYIEKNGPVFNKDILKFGKEVQGVKWKQNSGANLMELLWATGKLAIVGRDDMFQKKYDVVEKKFRKEELKEVVLDEHDLWYERLNLHIRSFPVTDSRISISKAKKVTPSRAKDAWTTRIGSRIEDLITLPKGKDTKNLTPIFVYCKEVNRIYIVPHNWKTLTQAKFDDELRLIAPLDPLIWDRKILREVFGFDYVWEIYKPIKDRKWGYYVLPLLYKGKFIGRLEGNMKKAEKILRIFNIYPEGKKTEFDKIKPKLMEFLDRWREMVGAKSLEIQW